MKLKPIFMSIVLMVLIGVGLRANTIFNQDGIKINYDISKEKMVFVPSLNKKVIIWKSTIVLSNNNNRPVSVIAPCCLYYAFCFLFPHEIAAVQSCVPDIQISDIYKTFATSKPTMLEARQKVKKERFFATYDDVNLNNATYNLEVKYSF